MGFKRKKKRFTKSLVITQEKLKNLILEFLHEHEANIAADFKVEQEVWKQILANELSDFITRRIKRDVLTSKFRNKKSS